MISVALQKIRLFLVIFLFFPAAFTAVHAKPKFYVEYRIFDGKDKSLANSMFKSLNTISNIEWNFPFATDFSRPLFQNPDRYSGGLTRLTTFLRLISRPSGSVKEFAAVAWPDRFSDVFAVCGDQIETMDQVDISNFKNADKNFGSYQDFYKNPLMTLFPTAHSTSGFHGSQTFGNSLTGTSNCHLSEVGTNDFLGLDSMSHTQKLLFLPFAQNRIGAPRYVFWLRRSLINSDHEAVQDISANLKNWQSNLHISEFVKDGQRPSSLLQLQINHIKKYGGTITNKSMHEALSWLPPNLVSKFARDPVPIDDTILSRVGLFNPNEDNEPGGPTCGNPKCPCSDKSCSESCCRVTPDIVEQFIGR